MACTEVKKVISIKKVVIFNKNMPEREMGVLTHSLHLSIQLHCLEVFFSSSEEG